MKKCKCCDKDVRYIDTCSKEHGMIYRYLKKFDYDREDLLKMTQMKESFPNLNMSYIHTMYNLGLESPKKCQECGDVITKCKEYGKISNFCSNKCRTKHTTKVNKIEPKTCKLCNKTHFEKNEFCSQSCTKQHKTIVKEFGNIDIRDCKFKELSFRQQAYVMKNDITDYKECVVCGTRHLRFHKNVLKDTCSEKCANVRNKNNINDIEIIGNYDVYTNYRIKTGIFIEKICKVCNNPFVVKKKHRKQICCSNECLPNINVKNLNNYNVNYIRSNFIDNGLFKMNECMEYFNASYEKIKSFKEKNDINEPNNFTSQFMLANEWNDENIKQNDRTVIKPKELDILFVDKSLAVEYDGLMYHSSGLSDISKFSNTDKYYHIDKTNSCEMKGIQLYHIFESEYIIQSKKEIWISLINNKLMKSEKIYARKCTIRKISHIIGKDFLDNNHLQGHINSSIRYGVYHNDDLVMVATFGKARRSKWKGENNYELLRLCTKKGLCVVGGASKLIRHFESENSPDLLISYANRRWSQGNLYKELGFEHLYNTQPNYFYFHPCDKILKSREQFQKHKLKNKLGIFDNQLTETENMYNNGYRKIYDCGNMVFVKKY